MARQALRGANRQAAPRRNPHAVRLAHRAPGCRDQSSRCGVRALYKHVVRKGKTPILEADEARQLIESIDVSTPVGLRDRALIALLIYTFARVSAAIGMNVEDYYVQGRRSWSGCMRKGANSMRCLRTTCLRFTAD